MSLSCHDDDTQCHTQCDSQCESLTLSYLKYNLI